MILYFAYGSNMNQDHLEEYFRKQGRIWTRRIPRPAVLKGYRLDFNYYSCRWNAGAANIMPSAGDEVWGLLYEVDEDEFTVIKSKEGYPSSYDVKDVVVEVRGLPIPAKTFKVCPGRESSEFVAPAAEYCELILRAAEEYRFPAHYVERLNSIRLS